jgi:hypothetical protein
MEQTNEGISPRKSNRSGATANQLANCRAAALAPAIRELMAAGFVSQRELMHELNRRGIPCAGGGKWHRTSIARVLIRLGLIKSGHGNNGLALARAANIRADALGPTILRLRKAGFSVEAVARELNQGKIPTPLGAKWHRTSVGRVLQRLESLDRPSEAIKRPFMSRLSL